MAWVWQWELSTDGCGGALAGDTEALTVNCGDGCTAL